MTVLPLSNSGRVLVAATGLPLAAGSNINIDEAQVFNSSVDFKLRCAEYYLERLKETLKEFPARALARARGPNLFEVNLFLDGFLTSSVSASDVFGHEINIYYGKPTIQPRFYLHDVVNALVAQNRAPTVVAHLQPALDFNVAPLPLVPRLKKYRNCSSHRSLIETATILSGMVTYQQQMTGTALQMKPQCYMPDDPDQFPCTYVQNIEVVNFCEKSFTDLVALLNGGYARIEQVLNTAVQLPI